MKIFRTTLLRSAVAAAMMLLAAACEGVGPEKDLIDTPPVPDEEQTQPTLSVRIENLDFGEEDDFFKISVTSNTEWWVETDSKWIHGDKSGESSLIVSVDPNAEPSTRAGSLTVFASEELSHTITVRQLGWGKDILLSATEATMEADGGEVAIEITTNFDVKATPSEDWIAESVDTRAHPVQTKARVFIVKGNFDNASRKATITFSDAADGESDFEPKTFTVSQKGLSDYAPGNAGSVDDTVDYVQVKPTGAEVSDADQAAGHGIELTYDGRYDTYFTTDKLMSTAHATLTYRFDNERIDRITYIARKDSQQGRWKSVTVSYQTAGSSEWESAGTYSCNGDTTITFQTPLRNVTALRFVVFTIDSMYVSAAEVEFCKPSDKVFDYATLFTDRSCSELRDGVTDEDIAACEHLLYRNLARWMKDGTYDTEFRAAEYRAFDDPNVQAAKEIAVPYSILDNPTGMVVKKDEELVVLAELNGRSDVRLAVYEFDRSAYEDNGIWNYSVFSLVSGVNKIKMPRPGMLYIMYNVEDWREAPPVRIHFASGGTVNGYYDTQKHGPDRWNELLSNAKNYKIFDVVGRYSHMVYEVGHFRQYTKDVYVLAEIYDEIVYREQVFCGLMRNRGADELRHNRMLMNICYPNSTTNAYMADGFISFIARMGQLSYAMNIDRVRGEGGFVLAHEIGHFHSNWFSRFAGTMTEVTNNTLQMYVTCEMYGGTSSIKGFDGYTTGWNQVIVPKASHHAVVSGYSYSALAPLWALELYFGRALGRSPKRLETFADDMAALERADQMSDEEYAEYFDGFYPALFDRMRDYLRRSEENKKKTNAQYMMQFAVEACHAAKMDLTDFFTKWGFFTGEKGCEVDEADREAALKEIADAGYPPVTDAVEYITDDTWQLFREKAKVVVGTATANKNGLTINGCSNVVAYELYNDGKLTRVLNPNRLAGNSKNNTFPDVQWKEGYKLYAVQYDSTRLQIEVSSL